MIINIKMVMRLLGALMMIEGISMLPSLLVSALMKDGASIALVIPAMILLAIGAIASLLSAGIQVACSKSLGRGDKLETLLQKSDFIILCMALNDDTYHMLNAETLKQVKPGAFLVNMARGGLVDTAAMIEALENGTLGGAGLDVFEEQPLSPESPLWEMPTVYITPHTTPQVPDRDGRSIEIIRENARRFEAGEPLMNLMRKSDMMSGEGHTSGFAAAMNANMKPNPQIIKMLEKHLGKRGWTDPSEWM